LSKIGPLSFLYRYTDIGFQDNDVFNQTQKVGKDRVMEKASTPGYQIRREGIK
jgi:hypothetical protein